MSPLGSPERPMRVAVVGSGPSGFYATDALLTSLIKVKVDMYDRLPAPYGLVRYGVAPDHPKIKNVIKIYEKTAANGQFSFFGNVTVGKDISIKELFKFYEAILFSCGAQTDRKLDIPGEELPGSYTATEFVAWYNGHPEYRDRKFDLSHEVAVVVGQGNVAMDVSRILCKTADELKNTDISTHALEVLSQSKIKEVHLIGRRGPVQAAFTPPEIKEFGELAHCDPVVDPAYLNINPESQAELDDTNHPIARKNFEILKVYATRSDITKPKKFIIHFYKSPKKLKGNGKVEQLVLEKNKLNGPAGKQQATGTGEFEEMRCGIFFRSVGYRGVPINGVPFDDKKGIFPNVEGRITDNGQNVIGLYCAGWIKRGPLGVIGTNKADSEATVKNLLEDVPDLRPCESPDSQAAYDFIKMKGIKVVDFAGWKKIDAAEISRGQALGKPREKFVKVDEMLTLI